MALAGITAVGEFHYLHHDPAGRPYADPNQMGEALIEAAGRAGVRLTLIDTCYLRAGLDGRPLAGAQVRFGDGDADAWAERAGALRDRPGLRVAAGVHSVRAVDPAAMATVAAWAEDRQAPLHLHLSEQRAENEACLAATGRTPAALASSAGVLGPRTTAVHATHLTGEDVALLGATGTTACFCPTTERDLADGVGPARALAGAGSPLCLGSDSHAVIDLFEEARAVELDERLASRRRGHHRPADLLAAATASGMDALGWDAGRLAPGRLADLVTVGLDSVRLAGARPADAADHLVFAATAADVTSVVVAGRQVVEDGRHLLVGDVAAALARAIAALDSADALSGRPRTTWSRFSAVGWASSWTWGVGPPPAMSTWRVARPARRWNREERTLPLWALATGTTVVTRIATPTRAYRNPRPAAWPRLR